MRIPAFLTKAPRKLGGIAARFRGKAAEPTGMSQIEVPLPDVVHPSGKFPEIETGASITQPQFPNQYEEQDGNQPTDQNGRDAEEQPSPDEAGAPKRSRVPGTPLQRHTLKPSRKVLLITAGAALTAITVAVVVALAGTTLLSEDAETPSDAPIVINLPLPEPTATVTPTEPMPRFTIAPLPTQRPMLPPPPTLTPTPLPPTPTLPPPPTYAPPTATTEPTPTPRNLRYDDNPPHIICVKYTLDDLPQRGITIRLVMQENQRLMLGRAGITDQDGVACLQRPMHTLDETVVPVVAGWTWDPVDGAVVLTGNQNVRQYLEVKRCTGAQGHLPVIRASGERKCPYKR